MFERTFISGRGTSGDITSPRIGSSGMASSAIGSAATLSYLVVANHPGVLRLATSSTINTGGAVSFGNYTAVASIDASVWSTKDWDYYWVGALGTNSTGLTYNVFATGVGNVATTANTGAGWRVRYDTSLATPDSNLMFQVCNASGSTGGQSTVRGTDSNSSLIDSGITPVAGAYYHVHIWHRMVGMGSA